jgi:hypothetical protein
LGHGDGGFGGAAACVEFIAHVAEFLCHGDEFLHECVAFSGEEYDAVGGQLDLTLEDQHVHACGGH